MQITSSKKIDFTLKLYKWLNLRDILYFILDYFIFMQDIFSRYLCRDNDQPKCTSMALWESNGASSTAPISTGGIVAKPETHLLIILSLVCKSNKGGLW